MQIHAGWLFISAAAAFGGAVVSCISLNGLCSETTTAGHIALMPLGLAISALVSPAALAIGAAIGMPRSRS